MLRVSYTSIHCFLFDGQDRVWGLAWCGSYQSSLVLRRLLYVEGNIVWWTAYSFFFPSSTPIRLLYCSHIQFFMPQWYRCGSAWRGVTPSLVVKKRNTQMHDQTTFSPPHVKFCLQARPIPILGWPSCMAEPWGHAYLLYLSHSRWPTYLGSYP